MIFITIKESWEKDDIFIENIEKNIFIYFDHCYRENVGYCHISIK